MSRLKTGQASLSSSWTDNSYETTTGPALYSCSHRIFSWGSHPIIIWCCTPIQALDGFVTELWLEACINDGVLHPPNTHQGHRPIICQGPLPLPNFAGVKCCVSQFSGADKCVQFDICVLPIPPPPPPPFPSLPTFWHAGHVCEPFD